ncbi:hypothetical protein MKW98_029735, partial [Papaver atlanticum]
RFKDLTTCTNDLVPILAILILHVPVRFRKFSFDSEMFVRKGNKGVDLLASLCKTKIPCSALQCKAENLENVDTEGLTFFEDLVKESSFSSSLIVLERDYDVAMNNKNDLDEWVFVNVEDSLHGTGSLSGGAMNITGF